MTAISASKLRIVFGAYVALEDISIHVPEGTFLAIVGPNGAGKSTLIRAVLGLIAPTSGSLTVLGRNPADVPPAWIGYVPQLKSLDRQFPAIALELVASGLRPRWPWRIPAPDRDKAMAALASVGMAAQWNQSVGTLSGGQLQRVYMARTLVRRPRMVLLDEPATGMDAPGELDFYTLLEKFHQESGATVVMVTHDLEVAAHHADQVLMIDRRLVAEGKAGDVLGEENLRRAYGHQGHAHAMLLADPHDHAGHDHDHD